MVSLVNVERYTRGKIEENGDEKERRVMGERRAGHAGTRSIDARNTSHRRIEMQ
jgi:hypothetical protein